MKRKLKVVNKFTIRDEEYVTFLLNGNAHAMTWEEYQKEYGRYFKSAYEVIKL